MLTFGLAMTGSQDKYPEIATNETWRESMTRARKAHGFSQQELADKLECTQPLISKIESGEVQTTALVIPICGLLGIAIPEHVANPDDGDWIRLIHTLRHKRPVLERHMHAVVTQMVEDIGDGDGPDVTDPLHKKS